MFVRFYYFNHYFCKENSESNSVFIEKLTIKCGKIFNEYFNEGICKNKALTDINQILQNNDDAEKIKVKKLLLVLHGWGASSLLYENICICLAGLGYFVVCPDMAGFGENAQMKRSYFVYDYAMEIYRLLELIDYQQLFLLGHSFGARVIFKMIELKSKGEINFDIDKIILTGAAGLKKRLSLFKKIKVMKFKRLKKKCEKNSKYFKKLSKYGSTDYKNISSPLLQKTFVRVVNEDFSHVLNLITCPCHLIFGEKDKETPTYVSRKMKRGIKNATLDKLPGAAHYAFLDKPFEFCSLLDKYLG